MYWSGSRRISAVASSLPAAACLLPTPQPSCVEYHRDRYYIGPIVFLLLTADLLRLVERHNLRPHMYADDTQIYGFCRQTAATQHQKKVSACIDDVAAWMQSNRLQLNISKTEVIWCASNRRQHQLRPQVALRVGTDHVKMMSHQLPRFERRLPWARRFFQHCLNSMQTLISRHLNIALRRPE